MFNVVTFGGATQDNLIKISGSDTKYFHDEKSGRELIAFEHGAKIPITEAASYPGGGALNVAVALKKLGLKPAPVIAVGRDSFGQNVSETLRSNKIIQDYVLHLQGVHTAFSTVISTDKGDRTVFVFRGASDCISREYIKNFEKLAKADLFVVSNLSGKSQTLLAHIFSLKEKNPNLKIAWNPGRTQIEMGLNGLKEYLIKTDVLLVNKEEAETLTGLRAESNNMQQLKLITSKMRQAGTHIAVITDSRNGAVAETPRGFYSVTEFPSEIVNTTGAGDSFLAGLVAGLHYTHDIQQALLYGSINAASTIRHIGAQNGYLTEEAILESIQEHPEFSVHMEI